MKKMILLVALATATSAWAQAPAQKKDAAKPEAAKPVIQEVAKPKVKRATVAGKSKRNEDARHCLERANNTEIIKCAEAYL
jgi:hypothetical protein